MFIVELATDVGNEQKGYRPSNEENGALKLAQLLIINIYYQKLQTTKK
ncbi:hypothetical protein SAMN04487897_10362 [Paenibacillus sp. yr247]|nr:hypothetical protein SAMN04487897_10362 [Paenibacillus sp. yr247]